MRDMERSSGFVFCLLLLAAAVHSHAASVEIAGLGNDGWHTWQVKAVESAPEMCCYTWEKGAASRRQCDLDRRSGGFSSSDDESFTDDGVQMLCTDDVRQCHANPGAQLTVSGDGRCRDQ